jgi:lipopolysaccharide/colanic/teichoic acid biosynthesis glycosyltransferase
MSVSYEVPPRDQATWQQKECNSLLNLLKHIMVLRPEEQARFTFDPSWQSEILPRELFMKMLCLERKRTERSGRRFVLMLLESGDILKGDDQAETFEKILSALSRSTRETDIIGWYGNGTTIGVIFTEIGTAEASVVSLLARQVNSALGEAISDKQRKAITLSFQVFPDDCTGQEPGHEAFSNLYPDLLHNIEVKKASLLAKRCIDIFGSLFAIFLLSPLLLLIAAAIKVTSRGPILFRQQRLGQYGKSFTFLKFRSMYAKSDQSIHEAYVKQFIAAQTSSGDGVESRTMYKLKADPRVTPVGRLLRRTSLDELPQFFNSLMGQMALVGPRPPVPYEFNSYQIWHRRRLLAVKPGITGFWQVKGRSRVKFNEMVRMDLEYARTWSLWLDIKILWQTPHAVISGEGAC